MVNATLDKERLYMTRRHSENEKRAILRKLKFGATAAEICNEHMISQQTLQRWESEHDPDELRKAKNELKKLRRKYSVLKELLIEKELDLERLRSALSEKCASETF